MKRIVALVLCITMLCSFTVLVMAYEGENYIQFSSSEVTFPTSNKYIAGDSNGDGVVNMLDVMASLRYVAGTKTSSLRDSIDTNSDGVVNVADAFLLLRHILGEEVGLGELVG